MRFPFEATPLLRAASLSRDDREVYLKIETGLPTGSFKVRGALHALSLNVSRRPIGEVVAASTGNHGAAVAWAGRQLGVPAVIFLPENPNPVKAARIRDLGAHIIETGADLSAAIDAAAEYASAQAFQRFFLHDASDPDVPDGAGTIGAEIIEQLPSVRAIYVPMGDTALIRGVAAAAKRARPGVRVIGVAAERAPAYANAWHSGQVIETAAVETIADGLAVRRPLEPNVAAIRARVDEVRLVGEEQMLDAMAWLVAREGVTAEPAGAAATAALLAEREGGAPRPAVLLVTGGNVAPDVESDVRRRLR